MKYEENFLFRKRTHSIIEDGIKTEQNSFFNSSAIETKFNQIGSITQYKSELKLSELVTSIVFLILGIKGLSKNKSDDILFAISVILIAVAMYWTISILFQLKHVGSFYFSDTIKKQKDTFEIKSKYPASAELNEFIETIISSKKTYDINYVVDSFSPEITSEEIRNEISYLKRKFLLTEEEFEDMIRRIRDKRNTDDNKR